MTIFLIFAVAFAVLVGLAFVALGVEIIKDKDYFFIFIGLAVVLFGLFVITVSCFDFYLEFTK